MSIKSFFPRPLRILRLLLLLLLLLQLPPAFCQPIKDAPSPHVGVVVNPKTEVLKRIVYRNLDLWRHLDTDIIVEYYHHHSRSSAEEDSHDVSLPRFLWLPMARCQSSGDFMVEIAVQEVQPQRENEQIQFRMVDFETLDTDFLDCRTKQNFATTVDVSLTLVDASAGWCQAVVTELTGL